MQEQEVFYSLKYKLRTHSATDLCFFSSIPYLRDVIWRKPLFLQPSKAHPFPLTHSFYGPAQKWAGGWEREGGGERTEKGKDIFISINYFSDS